jgi:hypothetical protein
MKSVLPRGVIAFPQYIVFPLLFDMIGWVESTINADIKTIDVDGGASANAVQ